MASPRKFSFPLTYRNLFLILLFIASTSMSVFAFHFQNSNLLGEVEISEREIDPKIDFWKRQNYFTYSLQQGETKNDIAQKFGIDNKKIKEIEIIDGKIAHIPLDILPNGD